MSRINGFIGRRNFLRLAGTATIGTVAGITSCSLATNAKLVVSDPNHTPVPPDEALKRLLDGNRRFVQQIPTYSHQSRERIQSVAQVQYPFAAILGCADSRVPAEIIFDQGVGDLFVVRVAGNVASDAAIGSLEYATQVLGCQLIVVLGHERCGAVVTALENKLISGKMGLIIEQIKPALKTLKFHSENLQNDAVIANIKYQSLNLHQKSSVLAELIRQAKLKIIGVRYDLDTGQISIVNT